MADLSSTRVFGKLTVMHDVILKANAVITGGVTADSFTGDGSALTALNASQITSGTIPEARLPASALVGDTNTTYSAGTGLSLSGTTFNVDNPFNPSGNYASLRARSTTKGDVGLSNVTNVRQVNRSGDTMTGALTISHTNVQLNLEDSTYSNNYWQFDHQSGDLNFRYNGNDSAFTIYQAGDSEFFGDVNHKDNATIYSNSAGTEGARVEYNATSKSLEYNFF